MVRVAWAAFKPTGWSSRYLLTSYTLPSMVIHASSFPECSARSARVLRGHHHDHNSARAGGYSLCRQLFCGFAEDHLHPRPT